MWLVDKRNKVIYKHVAEVCPEERSSRIFRSVGGPIYQTTRRHIPEDRDIHINGLRNKKETRQKDKYKRKISKQRKSIKYGKT
jgi:hypothetical protein